MRIYMADFSNLKRWLCIGLLLRLLAMPFTLHGDALFVNGTPHFLAHGDWNAYATAHDGYGRFYYPPLSLVFTAAMQWATQTVFSSHEKFLHLVAQGETKSLLDSESLYLSLFLLKLPYLFVEVLLFSMVWRLLKKQEDRRGFAILWGFNPLVIYGVYMIGQIDLLPTLCVVLAFYFCLQEGKGIWACALLGFGCLFKIFPILFLPLVVCLCARSWRQVIVLFLFGSAPVVAGFGFFYGLSGNSALQVFSIIPNAAEVSMRWDVWLVRAAQGSVYGAVCYHILSRKKFPLSRPLVVNYFLLVYLALYWSARLPQTYYFLWGTPFAILFIMERPDWKKMCLGLLGIIFAAGLGSRESFIGLFAPVNPEFFLGFPSLRDAVGFFFNLSLYDTLLRALFNGFTGYMAFDILKMMFIENSADRALKSQNASTTHLG
jgi:hypothetical protein